MGYFMASLKLRRDREDLEERERRLKHRALDLQRDHFQSSTSRIHARDASEPGDDESASAALLDELRHELAQERLDREILLRDHDTERTILTDQIERLKEEIELLRGTPAMFSDIEPEPESATENITPADAAETTDSLAAESDVETEEDPLPENEPDSEPSTETVLEARPTAEVESEAAPRIEAYEAPEAQPLPGREPEPEPMAVTDESADLDALDDILWQAPRTPGRSRPIEPPVEPAIEQPAVEQPEIEESEIEEEDAFRFHWTPAPPPPPSSGAATTPEAPAQPPRFRKVSDWVTPAGARPALQDLLGLSDAQYGLLADLGYASVDRIASLTPAAVARLADLFGIPASRIEMRWIPDAEMAQFSPEFSPGQSRKGSL